MATTTPVRIGGECFWLGAADAAEVRRIAATDAHAAHALARQRHRPGTAVADTTVYVPMLLMDSAPAPAQAPVSKERTPTMTANTMTAVRIGDADFYADRRVADELAKLQREVAGQQGVIAALNFARTGGANTQIADAAQISAAAKQARLADEARRRDPATAYGAYCDRLANAWKTGGAAA